MRNKNNFSAINAFELDDHLVLLKDGADRIQVLNPISGYIWKACQDGTNPKIIAADIADCFDIPLGLALQDVQTAIAQWSLELTETDLPSYDEPQPSFEQDLPNNWRPEKETIFQLPRFTLRVRYDSADIAHHLDTILAYLKTSSTDKIDHVIDVMAYSNHYCIVTDGKIGDTADSVESAAVVTFREIAKLHCSQEDWLAVLHAAGVAWHNTGIIFPAASGSGKTTLAAALIQHGFDYINDDIIPIERSTGQLIPLPVSLCLKSGSWEALQSHCPELAAQRSYQRYNAEVKFLPPPQRAYCESAYTARYLIIPCYGPDVGHQLERVSAVEGLQAIMGSGSLLSLPLKADEIGQLTAWVGKLDCYRLTYNDLNSAIKSVTELVSIDRPK